MATATKSSTTAFKPGQTIRCTLVQALRTPSAVKTVSRLMRLDATINRRLKSASEYRMRTLVVRSRGKRPWEVRQRSAKYVDLRPGATWTIKFYPQIGPDLASVARYVKAEAA